MRAGLLVIGQFATAAAILFAVVVVVTGIIIFDVIAIAGCAICDSAPPAYPAAVIATAIGATLLLLLRRAWLLAFRHRGYRDG